MLICVDVVQEAMELWHQHGYFVGGWQPLVGTLLPVFSQSKINGCFQVRSPPNGGNPPYHNHIDNSPTRLKLVGEFSMIDSTCPDANYYIWAYYVVLLHTHDTGACKAWV